MSIKKPFVELLSLLEANKDKKVSTIIEQVRELAASKKVGSTAYRDENDQLLAVFCYEHKQWEIIADVEYGSKKHSGTGLNTMCKQGVNQWTKKQKVAKDAKAAVLDDVVAGKITAEDVQSILLEIETARNAISDDKPVGYATVEELETALANK